MGVGRIGWVGVSATSSCASSPKSTLPTVSILIISWASPRIIVWVQGSEPLAADWGSVKVTRLQFDVGS